MTQLRLTCLLREEIGFVLLKFIKRSLEWKAFLPKSLKTAGELCFQEVTLIILWGYILVFSQYFLILPDFVLCIS